MTVRDFTGLVGGPTTVTVRRTLQEVGGVFCIKPRSESAAGTRQVPLPEWVATMVRRHVKTYGQRLDDTLIVNKAGGLVSRGYARLYILRPARVRAGLMGEIFAIGGHGECADDVGGDLDGPGDRPTPRHSQPSRARYGP